MKPQLIVAPTYAQAHQTAQALQLAPWRYVSNVEQLRGLEGCDVYFHELTRDLPDYDHMRTACKAQRLTVYEAVTYGGGNDAQQIRQQEGSQREHQDGGESGQASEAGSGDSSFSPAEGEEALNEAASYAADVDSDTDPDAELETDEAADIINSIQQEPQ